MGGPTILPWQYAKISDWDLIHVYLAPREEDGTFILLRERLRRAGGQADEEKEQEPPEDPITALNVPREALFMGVPMQYVLMFWQVWRRRGMAEDQIMEKFREQVKEVPPHTCFQKAE